MVFLLYILVVVIVIILVLLLFLCLLLDVLLLGFLDCNQCLSTQVGLVRKPFYDASLLLNPVGPCKYERVLEHKFPLRITLMGLAHSFCRCCCFE